MRLFSALQSMRLCAAAGAPVSITKKPISLSARIMQVSLLVAQRLHGIEAGSASRGIQAGHQAHQEREKDGEGDQPQRNRPQMFRRKSLALEVDVSAEVDDLADRPAQHDAGYTPEDSHNTRFGEKDSFHVTVTRADGFHDADLAPALKNCHHQSVHDADGGDDQRQAAENPEERIQHAEHQLQTAAGIENRKSAEAHFL